MTATKAPKEKLTLKDSTDLLIELDRWIEDHVDEIEINGGALPDDLAALLDEIEGSREERAEAIAYKLDTLKGNIEGAKATAARATRRRKIWENVAEAVKRYAMREIERAGGAKIKAPSVTLRVQVNSAPSTSTVFAPEQLLAFYDASQRPISREADANPLGDPLPPAHLPHPLAPYLSVERVVSIDLKALGAAYEARRLDLIEEAQAFDTLLVEGAEGYDASYQESRTLRALHVSQGLTKDFPGVVCTRGSHLRVD